VIVRTCELLPAGSTARTRRRSVPEVDVTVVVEPEEPVILQADRDGVARIDLDADASGVKALRVLRARFGHLGSRP
jgi:hypothetical protein